MAKGQRNLESLQKCKGYGALTSTMYLQPFCKNKTVYKYMDFETAIICLTNSSIRFVEPTEWLDKYEGRFYEASYSEVCKDTNYTPKLYACCFTLNKTSEAAWKTYSYNKNGLAYRCLQFKIDLSKLRNLLNDYCSSNNMTLYESKMNYELTDEELNSIHLAKSPLHVSYFEDFSLQSYLTLLSLKRTAFYYEDELRYFIVPNNRITDKTLFVNFQWKDVVTEIFVDEKTTDTELEIVTKYCKNSGIVIVENNQKGVHLNRFSLYNMKNGRVNVEKCL